MTGKFAALKSRSYRTYLIGQSLANTGTWMQSIAQDWLEWILRLLTRHVVLVVVLSALLVSASRGAAPRTRSASRLAAPAPPPDAPYAAPAPPLA